MTVNGNLGPGPLGSASTWDVDKGAILADAAKVAEHSRSAGALSVAQVEALLAAYYRHVSAEDLLQRDPVDVYGAARSHYRLAADRPQGTAAVHVFTPTVEEHGWSCTHTVVEVVTDDMPFLVDSVTMELSRQGRGIHLVVHPQLIVRRDVTGRLIEIVGSYDGRPQEDQQLPPDALLESWIHVEIDRESDAGDLAQVERGPAAGAPRRPRGGRGLAEVAGRAPVASSRSSRPQPLPLPEQEIAETRELLDLARRQPLHLPRLPRVRAAGGGRRRRGAPRRARHRSRHPAVRPQARDARSARCRRRCGPRRGRRSCSS